MSEKVKIPINDIYIPALKCEDRYLYMFGGWGSGKSYSGVFKKLYRLHTERNHKFLFVRKVKQTLKESLFDLVEHYITNVFKTRHLFEINKTDKSFYLPRTGGKIIMTGMDTPEKIKSVSNITGILVEEITELSEEDFEELDRRLRGELPNYKQIIGMFNPVSNKHWLKPVVEPENVDFEYPDPNTDRVWRFGEINEKGQRIFTTVYNTTYEHNHFIDDDYETLLIKQGKKNPDNYEVGIRGRWGDLTPNNPAWWGFEHGMMKSTAIFNPFEPVYLIYDQNILPFVSCLCIQVKRLGQLIVKGKKVEHYRFTIYDEVASKPPFNTMVGNTKIFKERYPLDEFYSTLRIAGDSSLRAGSTLAKSGVTGLSQIQDELSEYLGNNPVIKPKGGNPPVAMTLEFCNNLISGEVAGGLKVDFEIHPKCTETLSDLKYQKIGADGKPIKEIHVDKAKGERWEKNGHFSDNIRYGFFSIFNTHWLASLGKQKKKRKKKSSFGGSW